MAVDVQENEMLKTYSEVVNFLIKTYVIDDMISPAFEDVMKYQKGNHMAEMDFYEKLWGRALRCGSVFSDK